jgi:HK97 gp10 family phage protein
MASEMNVFGIDKLITELKNYSEKVNIDINNSVKAAALNVESRAKMDCPVDMGTLRASINTRPIKDDEGYGYEVFTPLEYAPYVEFGTGTRVSILTGYEEYARQFKGQKSIVGMNAQPYLIPNFEMEKMALIENIKKIIGNV